MEYIILDEQEKYVLAYLPNDLITKYVVWMKSATGEYVLGHYFADYQKALADFRKRSKAMTKKIGK